MYGTLSTLPAHPKNDNSGIRTASSSIGNTAKFGNDNPTCEARTTRVQTVPRHRELATIRICEIIPLFSNGLLKLSQHTLPPRFRQQLLWRQLDTLYSCLQEPPKTRSEATSHRFGFEGPDEQAHKKLRARKDQLRQLADSDDVVKYDKFHTASLISRPSRMTFDRDIVVTAVTRTQPTPSLSVNPYPTPHLPPISYNQTPDGRTQATHSHAMPTPSVPE